MMGTPSSQMRGDSTAVMRPPSSGGSGIMLIRLMKKPVYATASSQWMPSLRARK